MTSARLKAEQIRGTEMMAIAYLYTANNAFAVKKGAESEFLVDLERFPTGTRQIPVFGSLRFPYPERPHPPKNKGPPAIVGLLEQAINAH